jgi:tRNA (guanine37-N1)-methyltransferase
VRIDVITIFPAMIEAALAEGVVGRARTRGLIDIRIRDLREFTDDRHRTVDDVPYGGGPGMVLKPEPIWRAVDAIENDGGAKPLVVLTSPQGTRFSQAAAEKLAAAPRLLILCGRYEGVDERVRARVHEEISIGDYVLSGGELAALVIVDAVARLVPGVVGDEQSVAEDSFNRGLLDFPHYTRPADWNGDKVPEVLLSGNHAAIRRWRKREALARTYARRPDLLAGAALDEEEQELLRQLLAEKEIRN